MHRLKPALQNYVQSIYGLKNQSLRAEEMTESSKNIAALLNFNDDRLKRLMLCHNLGSRIV